MRSSDPGIDDYIAKSAPFAKPILKRIRELVHEGCPGVTETLKWGAPAFEHHGLLCGMASFKAHCRFGFWKQDLVAEHAPALKPTAAEIIRSCGHLATVKDLPSRTVMLKLIRVAARLNEDGTPVPRPRVETPKAVRAPSDLLAALRNNPDARAGYDALSPSHKREYIEWITEAKRNETRKRRVEDAIEWMAEGKIRNWKYVRDQ